MKKYLAFLLAVMMVLSLTACGGGKKPEETAAPQNTAVAGNTSETLGVVEGLFHPATSSATGAYATIKISSDVKLDDETAWLGLCPAGKDYITEAEADDAQVIWFYYDAREEGDPYVYSCDFSSVEDGTYALVVNTSDDENIGYVIIQLLMTKDGDKVTFDYTDAKYNDRPSSIKPGSSDSTEGDPTGTVDPEATEVGYTEEFPEGDPAEYGREFWEERYPGENICPFYIDENGTERSYYWVSGFDGYDGSIESWLSQPFNWNGWHKTDDGCIVNEDETLKITDDWANGDERMSSFCTVTTETYEKE